MANEELCIRFSEKSYATKQEVSRALSLSNIDDIWNKILLYRSNFHRSLIVRNIEKVPYNLTLTPTIGTNVVNLERKMIKALLQFAKIHDYDAKVKITKEHYTRILYWVAKKYQLSIDENFLLSIINHSSSSLAPQEMILVSYYESLRYISEHYVDPIDTNYLLKLYSFLLPDITLDNLYRKNEVVDFDSRFVIGRSYNAAPVERIEPMMDNLFDFLKNSDLSPFIKAVTAYYFIYHIRPFDLYSEEMALLVFKLVLSHSDYDELGALLEWEQILSDNNEKVSKIINEVKKTNDLTYLLVYFIELGESITGDLLDALTSLTVSSIREEYYDQNVSLENEEISSHKDTSTVHISTLSDINEPLSDNASRQVSFEMNVALPTLPIGLEESDAMKIEEHLVEIYPTLKRGQAYFYARHCTIGKYYTIAQYKKLLHCAYETARTSMDNLVELGFYRKEKLNNKFIYTPIARR